jgi:hypothetical protein
MGFYIFNLPEPSKGKADRLMKECPEAKEIKSPAIWAPPEGTMYVCILYNPQFEAAALAYSEREMKNIQYMGPGDYRQRRWFTVPHSYLAEKLPHLASYINGEEDWYA